MIKQLITISSLLAASSAFGQSINFVVEKGELFFSDGTVVRNADNSVDLRDNISVWAGFAQGDILDAFNAGITGFTTSSNVDGLNTTLGTINWESVGEATGLAAFGRDFQIIDKFGDIGDTPLLLVSTSSSFDNLTPEDQVGLVGSTTKVIELAAQTVDFNSDKSWDIEYLGTLSSLTMQQVPEPSSFAALAGVMTLGFVMMRRRRA